MKPSLEGIVNFFDPRKENVVKIIEDTNHLPFPALLRYVALHHLPKMAARGGVLGAGVGTGVGSLFGHPVDGGNVGFLAGLCLEAYYRVYLIADHERNRNHSTS